MLKEKIMLNGEFPMKKWRAGLVLTIELYPLMDENFIIETDENNIKQRRAEENNKKILLPAIISSVNLHGKENAPADRDFNISTVTRWNTGEVGGFFTITNLNLWRYVAYDENENMIPAPKYIFDIDEEVNHDLFKEKFGVSIINLHYIEEITDEYITYVYPFMDEN